jgi:hypothetical protein
MFGMRISGALVLAVGLSTVCATGVVAASAGSAVVGNGSQSALNGVFRIVWTEKQLFAAGAGRQYAHNNHSTLTMTFRDGRFRAQIKEEPAIRCTGRYTIYTLAGAKRFSISMNNPTTCPELNSAFVATWSRTGGNLRFHIVSNRGEAGDEVTFGAKPWKRIG